MKKSMKISLLIASVLLFMASPIYAGSFGSPVSSVISMHIAGSLTINGNAAAFGDEVAILDNSGKVLGLFVVDDEGAYGDMNISGDYSASSDDEGAQEGEILYISVWQASTDTLYSGSGVSITAPSVGDTIYAPYSESVLHFEGGSFNLLNIQAR
ncbi:MAG: hypothetical protein Q7U10_07355 [Thermodesulfovibrionia bacterium]|nr:hypothetical protein [Thermodesulfovibrionia bacterium]